MNTILAHNIKWIILTKKISMRLSTILLITLILPLAGCIKSSVDTAVPADTRTYLVPGYIRSDATQALTVKLYLNKEDYYNDINIVNTFIIPGNVDSLEVKLDSNTTYYYDVLSDDHSMSNWAMWPYGSKSFNTSSVNRKYSVSNNPNNIHRALLLPDNKQSKWSAVGSFTKTGNSWDTMSAEGRNKSIIFKRSQVAEFTEGANTREFRFAVEGHGIAKNAFIIRFYDTEDLDLIAPQYDNGYMAGKGPISPEYNALSPYSQNNNLRLPVTDTFYLTNDASKHTFIMVREN